MITSDLCGVHPLPYEARAVIDGTLAEAGSSGLDGDCGYAYTVHDRDLLVWPYDAAGGFVTRLPFRDTPAGDSYVCFAASANRGTVAVVACTADGVLSLWPDVANPRHVQRLQLLQPPARVCAVAACTLHTIMGPQYVITVATTDNRLLSALSDRSPLRPKLPAVGTPTAARRKSAFAGAYNALKALSTPAKRARSQGPSDGRALQLHLTPLQHAEGPRGKLLVLKQEALECWLVHPDEQRDNELLWASCLTPVIAEKTGGADPLVLALAAAQPQFDRIFVWAQHSTGGGRWQHQLHSFAMPHPDALPAYEGSLPVQMPEEAAEVDSELPTGRHQLLLATAPGSTRLLLRSPGGAVVRLEAARQAGGAQSQLLACPGPNSPYISGISRSGATGNWLLWSDSVGALEVDVEALPAAVSPSGAADAHRALDLLLGAMEVAEASGADPTPLASGLQLKLEALGVFEHDGAQAAVASYSRGLIDQAPRSAATALLEDQLERKLRRHGLLLSALDASGSLARLDPHLVRDVFEDHERLHGVAAVYQAIQARRAEVDDAAVLDTAQARQQEQRAEVMMWRQLTESAGQRVHDGAIPLPPAEGYSWFVSRPSRSCTSLFAAAGDHTRGIQARMEQGTLGDAGCLQQLLHLSNLLACLEDAAEEATQQLQFAFGDATRRYFEDTMQPSWLRGPEARQAWSAILQLLMTHRKRFQVAEPWLRFCIDRQLPVAQRALTCYKEATARTPPTPDMPLLQQYRALREAHIGDMTAAVQLHLSQAADASPAAEPQEVVGLLTELRQLAFAHHSFPQLYTLDRLMVAEGVSTDAELLYSDMLDLMSEPGAEAGDTFAAYALDRMASEHRVSEMMHALPQRLEPALQEFVRPRPQLAALWATSRGQPQAAAEVLLAAPAGTARHRRWPLTKAWLSLVAAGQQAMPGVADEIERLNIQASLGQLDAPPMTNSQLITMALQQRRPLDAARALAQLSGMGGLSQSVVDDRWGPIMLVAAEATDLEPLKRYIDSDTSWENHGYRRQLEHSTIYEVTKLQLRSNLSSVSQDKQLAFQQLFCSSILPRAALNPEQVHYIEQVFLTAIEMLRVS